MLRNWISLTTIVALAGGLASCDKMKGMMGAGGSTDFRNAQVDVSGTPCSADGKFSTLILKEGKFYLANYQFEMFGDTKTGDVSGHTTSTDTNDAVFVGNCANNGQTSQVLFVYGSDGKRLGAADLTGNGKGLVQSYDIANSTIIVEQNQGNPPQLSRTAYALLNGKLADTATGQPANSGVVTASGGGDVDVISFQSFHDKLQPYGKWVDHPRWGRAWHPYASNFRPYENGHWEDNDEYGSVWVSADPWGDTPYHYGRWGYDQSYGGWLWVPDYTWGPAWVTWRTSDDNLGWFPIPPREWDGYGVYQDRWSSWYGYEGVLGAAAFYGLWSFVPAVDIFAGNIRGRIVDRGGYGRFIGRSRGWGRLGVERGHIVNRAFDRARFSAQFHHPLPATLHDFSAVHAHSVVEGEHIAEHERINDAVHANIGGTHVGVHENFGHVGTGVHAGFGAAGSHTFHGSTYGHTSAFGHSSGYSHSGSSMFGHGSSGGSAFGHTGSSGGSMFGHSGGAFGHSGSSGGGMFGHSGGTPSFGHSSGGSSSSSGGGNNHHHH
ncbi:MAG: DUF6600 domain-containing protein [Rhizomicrobium sp.]